MGIARFLLFQVESYVGHVRTLMEERDAIASEYEKENEQLRLELAQLQLKQGNPFPLECEPWQCIGRCLGLESFLESSIFGEFSGSSQGVLSGLLFEKLLKVLVSCSNRFVI